MFSIAFMVLVFVLTQTVSHSFPKVCAPLQRKFRADAAYRASRCNVFRLTRQERITTTTLAESGSEQVSFGVTHRTCTKPGAMPRPSSDHA
jgi:hypothetical protein